MATAWKFSTSQNIQISAPGLVPVRVTNDLSQDVCYMYISPETSDNWGDDQMGEYEVMSAGGVRVFFAAADTYDLMAKDCDGNSLSEQYGVVVQGETDWALSQGATTP